VKAESDKAVVALIDQAIKVILERGQSIGVMHDPKTGSVDAVGALCLSAGAKESDLLKADEFDFGIPQTSIPALYEAIDCIQHCVGEYITTWNDRSGLNEIVNDMRFVADYVARRS
jgi:hypothetical protein